MRMVTKRLTAVLLILSMGLSFNAQLVEAKKKVSFPKKVNAYVGAKKTIKLKNNKKKVKWKVSNKKVIKIVKKSKKKVIVKGLKAGKSKIVAKIGKKKYSCTVKVTKKKSVTDYSYKITPLLAPFNHYFIIETDNPDPDSFRLVDLVSKYTKDEEQKWIENLCERYYDVKYTNKKKGRINNKYIFGNIYEKVDGGKLRIQENKKYRKGNGIREKFVDTSLTLKCNTVKSPAKYLVDTYTKSGMSFFEKMDAIQEALDELAIYPRYLVDDKKIVENPYPFYATSPYPELGLNAHYDIYKTADESLLTLNVYPFVLDSLGFPGMIERAAFIIRSDIKVENSGVHYAVDITYNGKTKTYGGAGQGGYEDIYASDVKKEYSFDNLSNDFAQNLGLDSLKKKLLKYGEMADAHAAPLKEKLTGKDYVSKIGNGSWIKVTNEGSWTYVDPDKNYAYITKDCDGDLYSVSNAWVDGRHISEYDQFTPKDRFADYPYDDIIMRNQTYKTSDGQTKQGDLRYLYLGDDIWSAEDYYYGGVFYGDDSDDVPSMFVLTRDQVKKMNVDGNTNKYPEKGYIYDGKVEPGTPFKN